MNKIVLFTYRSYIENPRSQNSIEQRKIREEVIRMGGVIMPPFPLQLYSRAMSYTYCRCVHNYMDSLPFHGCVCIDRGYTYRVGQNERRVQNEQDFFNRET